MKDKNTMEELKGRYLSMEIPKEGLQEMKKKIDMARMEKKSRERYKRIKLSGITVAAAALALVILPNTNADIANAMSRMPVIGRIVNVVTIDKYIYEDENNNANVEIPQISQTQGDSFNDNYAIEKVNKDMKEYTDILINQFNKDIEEYKEAHRGLDITWDVVTDTEEWFTLRIKMLETQASGYEHYAFYHINKMTGEIVELNDLFVDGADYIGIISDDIKAQMRSLMENEENKYFLDNDEAGADDFEAIKENQNFYFNSDNQLVIVFDEYEVSPGYMGSVEFIIENTVIKDILK
jgi:hypothetical protein